MQGKLTFNTTEHVFHNTFLCLLIFKMNFKNADNNGSTRTIYLNRKTNRTRPI